MRLDEKAIDSGAEQGTSFNRSEQPDKASAPFIVSDWPLFILCRLMFIYQVDCGSFS
jgi:hypothetical protein